MGRLTKTHTVAFRVDGEEFRRIDEAAAAEGLGANEWCRALVLARLGGAQALDAGQRIVYEEVACLRYLFGHGMKLLASGALSREAWEAVTTQADRSPSGIAQVLLTRRAAAAAPQVQPQETDE